MTSYLVLGVLVFVILYLISTYNWFQTTKTRITASIQEIGNQLKRQASLIPNLEASVKGYLKHEKTILTTLAEARKSINQALKSGSLQDQVKASTALSRLLPQINVIKESNPQLKGSETVTKLMDELRDTADKIMYARRTLIDLTADYNIKIVTFPSNLVALLFHFQKQPGLQTEDMTSATTVTEEETHNPKVNL